MLSLAASASNAASPLLANQARVQQARQQADQAEANARSLRAQADSAERSVQQAHRNVRAAERLSAASANTSTISRAPTPTAAPEDPRAEADVYTSTLAGAFGLAKPLLEIDVSAPAKNIVLASVFVAANQFLAKSETTTASAPNVPDSGKATVRNLFGQTTGALVSASA